MLDSYDYEIRDALHRKKLKHYHAVSSDSIVINELGLLHGTSRVDVAVINGIIHGYEIKSSKDTLQRFDAQIKTYSRCLQKLTFVIAPNHFEELFSIAPLWTGVIVASKGKNGGISFNTLRRAKLNNEFDAFSASHLLWKDEAQAILKKRGFSSKATNVSRKALCGLLSENLHKSEIVPVIKEAFSARSSWRADELRVIYGD